MASDKNPNIVLITMDTARAKNFSCYGHERNTSPFLDSIAEENVFYENTHSQSNWTLPSHASIFSGKYPLEHEAGIESSFSVVEDPFTEKLSERGYENIGIVNTGGLTRGLDFDRFFDDFTDLSQRDFFGEVGLDRSDYDSKLGEYSALFKKSFTNRSLSQIIKSGYKLLDDLFFLSDDGAKETNEIAMERISDIDEDNFFLFLNYYEPHGLYKPPQPFTMKYSGLKSPVSLVKGSRPGQKYVSSKLEPPEWFFELGEDLYDGEIRYLDSKLKSLYNRIKEEHPNTVFIFTSDHGEYFYEFKRAAHMVGLHEEVTHVPMIEVFPEDIDQDIEGQVELRQLHDHILSISEGDLEPIKPKDYSLSEYSGKDVEDYKSNKPLYEALKDDAEWLSRYESCINMDGHKLIWYSDGEKELLNLADQEQVEDEQVSEKLSEKLSKILGNPEEKKDIGASMRDIDDEEVKKNLKKLGYM